MSVHVDAVELARVRVVVAVGVGDGQVDLLVREGRGQAAHVAPAAARVDQQRAVRALDEVEGGVDEVLKVDDVLPDGVDVVVKRMIFHVYKTPLYRV